MKILLPLFALLAICTLSSCETFVYRNEAVAYAREVNKVVPDSVTFTYDEETTIWGRAQSLSSILGCRIISSTNEYIEVYSPDIPLRLVILKEKSKGVMRIVIQQFGYIYRPDEYDYEWQLKAFYYYLKTTRYFASMMAYPKAEFNMPDSLPVEK